MMGVRRAKEDLVGDYTYPEFRWLERGEGEPVLLLHGLMGRMDDWDDALDLLALSCRPMAPLLPIFHPGLPETSLAALADHAVGLLAALDIPHAVIGGNSLGGHVALTLALARPERVSGPRAPDEFVRVVDRTLMGLNGDYRTKRRGDVGMLPPRLVTLPAGTFYAWMGSVGRLGDQHKVPRVTNDRTLADRLLALAGIPVPAPLVLLGP